MENEDRFARGLGLRIKELPRRRGYTQEGIIALGFSARHWQQIESGRPITVRTLLRIAVAFTVPIEHLVRRLGPYSQRNSEGQRRDNW